MTGDGLTALEEYRGFYVKDGDYLTSRANATAPVKPWWASALSSAWDELPLVGLWGPWGGSSIPGVPTTKVNQGRRLTRRVIGSGTKALAHVRTDPFFKDVFLFWPSNAWGTTDALEALHRTLPMSVLFVPPTCAQDVYGRENIINRHRPPRPSKRPDYHVGLSVKWTGMADVSPYQRAIRLQLEAGPHDSVGTTGTTAEAKAAMKSLTPLSGDWNALLTVNESTRCLVRKQAIVKVLRDEHMSLRGSVYHRWRDPGEPGYRVAFFMHEVGHAIGLHHYMPYLGFDRGHFEALKRSTLPARIMHYNRSATMEHALFDLQPAVDPRLNEAPLFSYYHEEDLIGIRLHLKHP